MGLQTFVLAELSSSVETGTNSLIIGAFAVLWLALAYCWYGRRVERRLIEPSDANKTPADARYDGVDYCPAHRLLLFGHHFSSIAGAGPIIGPVTAVLAFGWVPTVLWVLLGVVFIGAVHDYLALMVSVRSGGTSIADVARDVVGAKARVLFMVFVWLALVLVVAVFSVVVAKTLETTPEIVIPTFSLIPEAMFFGWLVYRMKVPVGPATLGALVVLLGLIILGMHVPVKLPFSASVNTHIWMIVLLLYALVASVLPVWVLLQPRDYLSAWVLFTGMALGCAGLIWTHPAIKAPSFIATFSASQGPIWPMLFIMVACGAVSGFHALVAGGTTSKQLAKESHGRFVAFGAMLLEGLMATMAVLAVAAGLHWATVSGMEELSLQHIAKSKGDAAPIIAFSRGFGQFVAPLFGMGTTLGTFIGMTMLQTFVLTTLDTTVRLARFIATELTAPNVPMMRNRWIASLMAVIPAYLLAATGGWQAIWPVFGASNQLVAALALIVLSVYLISRGKPSLYTFIPAVFMLATTMAALGWLMFSFLFRKSPPSYSLAVISAVLLVLAFFVAFEARTSLIRGRSTTHVAQ